MNPTAPDQLRAELGKTASVPVGDGLAKPVDVDELSDEQVVAIATLIQQNRERTCQHPKNGSVCGRKAEYVFVVTDDKLREQRHGRCRKHGRAAYERANPPRMAIPRAKAR